MKPITESRHVLASTDAWTPSSRSIAFALGLAVLFGTLPQARAAETDVANVPLQTASSTAVKPNIMFILDNSTSMDETELPEGLASSSSGNVIPGYRSHLCNSLYYNPNVIYTVPLYYNGNPLNTSSPLVGVAFPNAAAVTFTNATTNGYVAGGAVRNLETQFNATSWTTTTYEMWPDGPDSGTSQDGGAYYFEWTGTAGAQNCTTTSTTNWVRRHWSGTNTPVAAPWTAAQKQNFANWFSYYRTRMLLMKYATAKAFQGIDDAVRLGFITINPGTPVLATRYLKINAYTTTVSGHKRQWYDKLLSQTTSGSTPLLRALSRVGRHYGKQTTGINNGMPEDPVQYYCQRNYAILTTDGYWNQEDTEPGVTLAGANMGSSSNYDAGTTPRPLFDSSNVGHTLADVAMYYYQTDLRPNGSIGALGFDVGTGELAGGSAGVEEDNATHQHMTTFTLGLGLSGFLTYAPNYKSGAGDFAALRAGTKNWGNPYTGTTTDQNKKRIDDLWHAAVNGRGQYFSAGDPESAASDLQTAINNTLSTPASTGGSGISSGSPNPSTDEDLLFTAYNKLAEWTGELEAYKMKVEPDINGDATDMGLPIGNPPVPIWKAEAKLAARVGAACDNRTIYIFDAGTTNKLRDFKWNTSACDSGLLPSGAPVTTLLAPEQAHFNQTNAINNLSHRSLMSTAPNNQPVLAAGAPVVNYIRGQSGNEDFVAGSATKFFRGRNGVLGDFVNSGATHVGKSYMTYNDALNPGYTAFAAGTASRTKAVYLAANNGMLHAFRALSGDEMFAYVPTMALPTLYTRANNNLQHTHKFLLDGTPVIADILDGGAWKTILVAPMGRGATGYYALDITDPLTPKAMWEFKWSSGCFPVTQYTDCDLGKSIGAPVVTKDPNTGAWIVLVTSGLNNIDGANKGKGFLYVLNAATGLVLNKIGTGAGDLATPSGLSEIAVYAPTMPGDNVATRVYGGDTLGNVWRFDLKGDTGMGQVSRLAYLTDSFGTPQPVTTKPAVSKTGVPFKALVVVPTGRYLGLTDLTDTNKQSIYVFTDNLLDVASPRSELASRVLSTSGLTRDVTCPSACTKDPQGWYVDLPDSGERGNVPPALLNGTLVVATNVPEDTVCGSGGYGFVNFFNVDTGGRVAGTTDAGFKIPDALITGIAFAKINGKVRLVGTLSNETSTEDPSTTTTTSDDRDIKKRWFAIDVPEGPNDFGNRRLSWRELIRQ